MKLTDYWLLVAAMFFVGFLTVVGAWPVLLAGVVVTVWAAAECRGKDDDED